jgi:Xaa-Pro aminopeptidase
MEGEVLILIKERLKIFREKIEKENLKIEGFLVTNLKNLYYLSSFDGEGIALMTRDKNYLLTDSRYAEQAQKESPDFKIITEEPNHKNAREEALDKIIEENKIKKIAFESNTLSYTDYLKYFHSFKLTEFLPTKNLIEQLRMIKDKEEITILKKAAHITTETLKEVFEMIKPGVRELDIATELSYTMRKKGAQKEAFNPIIVSGKRSSLIHGKPSEKKITKDELIIIDMGQIIKTIIRI